MSTSQLRTHATRRAAFVAAVGRRAFLLRQATLTTEKARGHANRKVIPRCNPTRFVLALGDAFHIDAAFRTRRSPRIKREKLGPRVKARAVAPGGFDDITPLPPATAHHGLDERNVGLMPMHVDRTIFHARSQKVNAPMGLFGRDLAIPLQGVRAFGTNSAHEMETFTLPRASGGVAFFARS